MTQQPLANFTVELMTREFVLIRDRGPWETNPTITNSAEAVVAMLLRLGIVTTQQRLFYADSEGLVSELTFTANGFAGFMAIQADDAIGLMALEAAKKAQPEKQKGTA